MLRACSLLLQLEEARMIPHWLKCQWTRWSAPYTLNMLELRTGRSYVEQFQQRTCTVCGKVQERTLDW